MPYLSGKRQLAESPVIRLRTLGALTLRDSGGEELRAVLAQPRRAALLAYLALATPRGNHLRDKLLALFWPELDSERARNALGQALHFLRRSLGAQAIVNRNGDAIGIDWECFWCDAVAFEEALDAGRVAEAVGLYRGDLLDGFHIEDAAEFERWLDGERARLAARHTKAVESLAAEREAAGDFQGAVAHWQLLSSRDPYSSRLAVRLMRALAAAGDPAAAMLQARQHERLVRDELGIAPDADVAALVRQLQAGQSGDAARPAPEMHTAVGRPAGGVGPPKEAASGETAAKHRHSRSRRIAMLAAALGLVSVGASYAVVKRETSDDAYVRNLYLRGRNAGVNRSLVGLQTAVQHYRQAIERDSSFTLGYAALSEAYALMAYYDFAPTIEALDSARFLAQRAVALDSTLPEARTMLGMSLANSGHFAAAEREFRSAIALGPASPEPHYWYGLLLVAQGRGKEALAEAELVLKLDPLAPRAALGTKRMATYLITGQRPYQKLPTAERRPILKVEPGEPWARARTALELAGEGRCAEALSEISRAQRLVPDSNLVMLPFVGAVHWSCGGKAHARALLAQMKRRSDSRHHGLDVAILHARFGEKDSAFVWLSHQPWMLPKLAMLSAAPFLDPLRSDPRFPQLMRRLGIR